MILLLLALGCPAGDIRNALLSHCLGCYVAYCVWPSQKKPGMERSGPAPTTFCRAGWGSRKEEHLLLQWNASAAGLHHAKFARLHMPVNMWSHKVCWLDVSFVPCSLCHSLAGWPGGWWGRGTGAARGQLLGWRLGGKDMLLRLAHAGPAGGLKDALLRRCLGCYVADCARPSQKAPALHPSTDIHPLHLSLTALSTGGQAMLGHWSQHHLRL